MIFQCLTCSLLGYLYGLSTLEVIIPWVLRMYSRFYTASCQAVPKTCYVPCASSCAQNFLHVESNSVCTVTLIES